MTANVEQRVNRLWYGGSPLYRLLLPLSWLFRIVVAVRRWAYRVSILNSQRVGAPVIVIGNISAGGTVSAGPITVHEEVIDFTDLSGSFTAAYGNSFPTYGAVEAKLGETFTASGGGIAHAIDSDVLLDALDTTTALALSASSFASAHPVMKSAHMVAWMASSSADHTGSASHR